MQGSEERRAGHALIWNGVQKVFSKALYLGGTLVLGRVLAPQDFGLVAIASVAVTTAMGATETGMTTAIVRSASRDAAHYDLAWSVNALRGALVCGALMLAAPLIARLFGDLRAVGAIRLLALVPLISSLASPRLADLIRELNFSRLALIGLGTVVVELGVSLGLAGSLGGFAIIIGKIAGAVALAASSYLIAPHAPKFRLRHEAGHELIAFGRWIFAIAVLGVTSDLVLKMLISTRLGVAALGLFSLADKLAETPNQLANEAVGTVAIPLYASLRSDQGRLQAALRSHVIALMCFLLPATALLVALAGPLEQSVLGPAWTGTSPMVVLLAIGYLFELLFQAIVPLLTAIGAVPRLFVVDLLQYIVLIGGMVLLSGRFGLAAAGIARILASLVVVVAGIWAAPPIFGPIAAQLTRSGVVLAAVAALSGG
ncbi:MAG TPA: oligosaccharide flippase family protein, partial [Steroidobacteraceae bacterium]|nr:oligosaccharide flippase family protein [Steroidobacteraceae bacterium]